MQNLIIPKDCISFIFFFYSRIWHYNHREESFPCFIILIIPNSEDLKNDTATVCLYSSCCVINHTNTTFNHKPSSISSDSNRLSLSFRATCCFPCIQRKRHSSRRQTGVLSAANSSQKQNNNSNGKVTSLSLSLSPLSFVLGNDLWSIWEKNRQREKCECILFSNSFHTGDHFWEENTFPGIIFKCLIE